MNSFAYIGVLRHLEETGEMRRVSQITGCSGGAMVGLLAVLGHGWRDMETTSMGVHGAVTFDNVLDAFDSLGLDSMDRIRHVLSEAVRSKLPDGHPCAERPDELTFADLKRTFGKDFVVYTTDLTKHRVHKFGTRLTPGARVVDAVLASCSIPFVFCPVVIGDGLHLDGALLCSSPDPVADLPPPGDDTVVDRVFAAKTFVKSSRMRVVNDPSALACGLNGASNPRPANILHLARSVMDLLLSSAADPGRAPVPPHVSVTSIKIQCDRDGVFGDDGFLNATPQFSRDLVLRGYEAACKAEK